MWDTRSVFILLDYVEALIFSLAFPIESSRVSGEDEAPSPKPDERSLDMFDFGFLFEVVKKILLEADNTVTLMRCIAFLYAHFEMWVSLIAFSDPEFELIQSIDLDSPFDRRIELLSAKGSFSTKLSSLVSSSATIKVLEDSGELCYTSISPVNSR
jgi:hypothetical protein